MFATLALPIIRLLTRFIPKPILSPEGSYRRILVTEGVRRQRLELAI
jgi:hypothetical protein